MTFGNFYNVDKIHINISNYASGIIENDVACFSYGKEVKQAAIIHRIILNCVLSPKKKRKLESLKDKLPKYEKGVVIKYRPNDPVRDEFLSDCFDCTPFEIPGECIKALIEEYALLPYFKREEIFFKERFDIINDCIKAKYSLRFRNKNNEELVVIPHKIEQDKWSSFNYLICCEKIDGVLRYINLRIAFLENFSQKSVVRDAEQNLSDEDVRAIEAAKKVKGVQFLSDDTTHIKVRLTQVGQTMYKRMLFLRPVWSNISKCKDGNAIYEFNCTERQIEYYFFKFGKEALVLEPEGLRQAFLQKYEEAVEKYSC